MEKLKNLDRKTWVKIGAVLAIVLIGVYVYLNFLSPSGSAKRDAEKYMNAVKNGKDDYKYLDIDTDGFLNVFDYKYLDKMEIEREKDIVSFSYADYQTEEELTENFEFKSYDEYKKHYMDIYKDSNNYEILEDGFPSFDVWKKGKYKDKHKFLYDVTIANGLGQKIYKKAEITMEKKSIDNNYKVVDIYIR